ncbi:MAG: FG-GAP-like repeat-containing protein [Ignavibacteriaceae bacterium]
MKNICYFLIAISRPVFLKYLVLGLLTLPWLNTELSAQIFTPLESAKINLPAGTTYGSAWIDYNSDGYTDLWLNNYDQQIWVFINNRDGSFTRLDDSMIKSLGTNHSGITWGDFDNNGYPDMFITTLKGNNELLSNSGNGVFERIINSPVRNAPSNDVHIHCSWVDYDNDGWLDLFIPTTANFDFAGGSAGVLNYLFHNNGDGTFTAITNSALTTQRGNNQSANFSDIDNDGDMDLFISEWDLDNWLFENNGDGTFERITGGELSANTNTSMTSCWGDFNNDGFTDLYVGNGNNVQAVTQKNLLYLNNGDKTFRKITTGDAVNNEGCTWTCITGDVDNDGDLDLFTGDLFFPNSIYLNDGSANFVKADEVNTLSTGTSGASFGDYDNDGFLDLFVPNVNSSSATLYKNNGNENNWINITCNGTISNNSAIGSRVKVKASISGKDVWQIREITGSQGFRSFNDLRVHFGLGDASLIDSLVIEWPSREITIMEDVAVNQLITVNESVPFDFLKGIFKANTLMGYSPFVVNFSEFSIANEANPVTSWSWDFNNDGIEDSKEKNPVFTYETSEEKEYSVSLTIANGSKTVTIIKENYIKVLPLSMQNIALAKKAAASSNRPSYYAPNIVDGNLNTMWWSQPSDTQWVQIELDSLYPLGRIVLNWAGNYASFYSIQVSSDSINWIDVTTVNDADGGIDEIILESPVTAKYFKLTLLQSSASRGYAIREIGLYRASLTDVENPVSQPAGFHLFQNYPNPFNPVTKIKYAISSTQYATLKLFNILGKEMAVLINEVKQPGNYEIEFDASGLSSGVYYYRLTSGGFSETKKMLFLK